VTHTDSANSGQTNDDDKTDEELLAEELAAYDSAHGLAPRIERAGVITWVKKSFIATSMSQRFFWAAALALALRSAGWLVIVYSDESPSGGDVSPFLSWWTYNGMNYLSLLLYFSAIALLIVALVFRRAARSLRGDVRFSPLGLWLAIGLIVVPLVSERINYVDILIWMRPAVQGAIGAPYVNTWEVNSDVLTGLTVAAAIAFLIIAIVLGRATKSDVRAQAVQTEPAVSPTALTTTNTMAIIAFVSAFFVGLVAVVLGHLALAEIRRTGQNGRGLAIAALWLGYIGVSIGAIALIAFAILTVVVG